MTTPTALITGASSGIGAEYARQLAGRGYDLILVARRENRLSALAESLPVNARVVQADLTAPDDLERIATLIADEPSLGVLVNNAGTTAIGAYDQLSPEQASTMLHLNVTAVERLARAAFAAFRSAGRGSIINISSAVAMGVYPGTVLYSATKAFVMMLSEGMAAEAEGSNVRVQAVLPAAVESEIYEVAGVDLSQLPPEIVMTASNMVAAALAGLDAGEVLTLPSLEEGMRLDEALAARQRVFDVLQSGTPASRYGLSPAA
ncbi:SDR family NAD(P)-dependent oxidoreductase [Vannielia litorea]|uniref:Short-chain dehydrogenase n=1 Tax=Vannielia litorea TaxID=1217970 RepID=A0A1N6ECD1_9RHOB|nr:SDR family NAD(P)-dependent oxidoreductase [Vannielia litorea]SIN80666.1 hypothetical protein SAMN05444002_0586 [Vannielia litorea]